MDREALKPILWDVDEAAIDSLPESFVIRRILSYGGVRLIFQATKHYGYGVLTKEFSSLSPRSMDPRRYHYLQTYIFRKQHAPS